MLRLYGKALRRVDAGWLNAFGWSNIGIERYFDEYFERTAGLNRIVSIGGFSADEIERLVEIVNERAMPGEIAAIELNASCHNVNFPFGDPQEALTGPSRRPPRDRKVSADEDYLAGAPGRRARLRGDHRDQHGEGLRLDPETGEPYLRTVRGDRAGDQADRAAGGRGAARRGFRPIVRRQDPRLRLPQYVWAGADAVSLGSSVWLQPMPMYALGPLEARIRRLIDRMDRFVPPAAARAGRRLRARAPRSTTASSAGSEPAAGPVDPPSGERPARRVITTGSTIDSATPDRLLLTGYVELGRGLRRASCWRAS
jgi:dihydroorotate dehydrogenase (NAD+) catalytic subunit